MNSQALATLAVPVNANDHVRGSKNAFVTLVEYGDYECPYCGQAHYVVQQLEQLLTDSMGFVFRHFPLTTVHTHAELAAEAAEAAAAQKKFCRCTIRFLRIKTLSGVMICYSTPPCST
jgi:protein-disulfide isomerase